jgi:hypothetical protein
MVRQDSGSNGSMCSVNFSAVSNFVHDILICLCDFQIFLICHIFTKCVSCVCFFILFIILSRHQHILSLLIT